LEDDPVQIPLDMLEPDTLRNVIETFITREGTDYGTREYSLDEKVAQVMRQLVKGEAHLVYDEESESCNIVSAP
jgi:uncharacterized protein YheU (UPF0270 family)